MSNPVVKIRQQAGGCEFGEHFLALCPLTGCSHQVPEISLDYSFQAFLYLSVH